MTRASQTVPTSDGIDVSFDLYRAAQHDTVVIICPGFFQSKDTQTFQQMSRALAMTVDVVAMDFRGHGRSGGLYTFSALETADLEAVVQWTTKRYPHIGLMGFSMGGAIAINTLARHPHVVQSLMAVSAPAAFEDVEFKWWTPEAIRTGVCGLDPNAGCRPGNLWLHKERAIEHVQQLAPTPILFLHGTRDVIVGVEHSQRLFAAAREPKRLTLIEGGGHAEALFRDDPQQFSRIVHDWFTQTLSVKPTSHA